MLPKQMLRQTELHPERRKLRDGRPWRKRLESVKWKQTANIGQVAANSCRGNGTKCFGIVLPWTGRREGWCRWFYGRGGVEIRPCTRPSVVSLWTVSLLVGTASRRVSVRPAPALYL